MKIVADTTVLVDIFLESRPRHLAGKRVERILVDRNYTVLVPFHALFEVSCTLKQEKQQPGYKISSAAMPLKLSGIPIDEAFVSKYLDVSLPYLKAGDFIFLCLAKKESAMLLTDDAKLRARAIEAGVDALTTAEFLERFEVVT